MKTLYLECNMGAAGDMLTAALLELHPDPQGFVQRMNRLGLPGVAFSAQPAVKCGITGTHFSVTVHGEEEASHDVPFALAGRHHHDHPHDHDHPQDHDHPHDHDHAHEPGAHGHVHANTKAVINRLARAIGHLESVKKMVEDGRDCSEVLIQIAAVRSAINNIGKVILQDHIQHCIVDAVERDDEQALDSLCQAIDKFIK